MLTIDDPAYFERLAEVEAAHWWSRGMWRLASCWLDRALAGRRGLRALDVGCGTGLTAARLAARPEVAAVVGLDPSPEALTLARRCHDQMLIRGSGPDLPFRDRSFDVATCFDVFQHLHAGGDARAAAELRRVLRPGGIALIRSNARGWGRDRGEGPMPYRLGELVGVIEGTGLAVRRATHANCLPALAQEVRGRLWSGSHRPHPAGGGLRIRVPPPWINRVMGGVAGAEAIVASRLMRLPFGHSTMVLAGRVE